ncbi:MAG: 2-keto-4-pentenoate hydratase [Congregibacter sp.]
MSEATSQASLQANASHQHTAAQLRDAYSGEPVPPLRNTLEPGDSDGAYAVQKINTDFWLGRDRVIAGRKIGLTSAAVQKQLGVDQPDFGVLFKDMQVPNNGTVDPSRLIQPKAEAEIAIVLGRDIENPDCSPQEFAAAAECAIAAIEIVDSRVENWNITFADTVADNGSSALFVLGDEQHALNELDLYSCGMVLEVDGGVASVGAGAACLGHPFNAGAWLARALIERGERLPAGSIVLTGALGPMVTLCPGQDIRVQIGGLGACGFRFAAG